MDKREFIDSVKAELMDVGQDLDYDNIVGGKNFTFFNIMLLILQVICSFFPWKWSIMFCTMCIYTHHDMRKFEVDGIV